MYKRQSEKIVAGDEIVVHMGNLIPFDGEVSNGEGMVNQASLTGESVPVRRTLGSVVYAGTVLEEGEDVYKRQDRIFRKFGLSGKSFIPMLIGSGCGVPGIMASRTIENDRDRKMTITVSYTHLNFWRKMIRSQSR